MEWIELANKNRETSNEVISFSEYMDIFYQRPSSQCRPTCKYIIDMFDYFNSENNLFNHQHNDAPAVYGQQKVLDAIKKNLENFCEEGFNNKFLLLIGPNGSSKTSIARKIMVGSEYYSKTDNGALYTFSWIFPIDNFVKGSLGLTSSNGQHNLNSYAHLEDKDISSILTSELKDHPLLLIPIEFRQKIIDDALAADSKTLDIVNKSYIYNGDISKKNRLIYDALLKSYKGDHGQVLKHIRVERFIISRRYSSSAVTIEPQIHLDARLQQITMDKRLASLPPSLQSLNLFSLQGETVMANRGILEFSDLLKRPLDTFKYLLMTTETKNINLQGILTELDIFFVGSSNEIHLSAFKQHPDFNSFRGRFIFLRVPYLLNYLEEKKIYQEQINNLSDKTYFNSGALNTIALFAVLTRIRPSLEKNYTDKNVGKLAASFSPIEKVLLYGQGEIPERLDSNEKQTINAGLEEIAEEFSNEVLYEGKFGMSPRAIKHIIYEISSDSSDCTFVDILNYLTTFIERKGEYDFLNISYQGEYHNPPSFINALKEYNLNVFDEELRTCLGLVDERSYETYLGKYINQISAFIKGEKIHNATTDKFEKSDMFFIQEFEKQLLLKEKAETFRSHLISKLGAYSLDNPGKAIVYSNVFPQIVKKLQASFHEEQKKKVKDLSKHLIFYFKELEESSNNQQNSVTLTKEKRQEITDILNSLQGKFHYSKNGSISLLQYLIKHRY